MGQRKQMTDREDLSGVRKAAILLLTMDEELSKEVIRDLDDDEIELIGQEIARLESVPGDMAARINDEFVRKLNDKSNHIVGMPAKFKGLLNKSLGEDKAQLVWQHLSEEEAKASKFLKTCDSRILANTLKNEHPQTISLVLSNMEVRKATEVVSYLPPQVQSDVIVRMAHLERVDKKIIEEIEGVLKEQLESIALVEGRRLGGVEVVAGMLNQMNRAMESEILEAIEESNPELADKIKQLMFTFEDLIKIDDKGMQLLLKDISSEDLTVALKGASEALKGKFLGNMSDRAAKMLKEDLEAMGPLRVSEVEKAQVKIAMAAKRLNEEGKIVMTGGSETFV
jgi:flagellar motor switch protein FliG